jgi:hypothetical protein
MGRRFLNWLGAEQSDVLTVSVGPFYTRQRGGPAGDLLATALVGCSVKLPPPPPIATAEGRACVQQCDAMHAVCTAGASGIASPSSGTSGGVLIGVIATSMMQHSAASQCADRLAACYGECSATSPAAVLPLQWSACGPRCSDGSAAVWLGLAGNQQQYVSIALSMCATRKSTFAGSWTCTAGTATCAFPGGALTGTVQPGLISARSEVPTAPGARCEFSLAPQVTAQGVLLRGTYRCSAPDRGEQAGNLAALPCP